MNFKKGISPVVAMALLLVVAVVAVTSFQTWFSSYSSQLYNDAEVKSGDSTNTQIERVIDSTLYFRNGFDNISISNVTVEGVGCNVSNTYSKGVKQIYLTNNCTNNLSTTTPEIVVYTDKGIYSEKYFNKQKTTLGSGSEESSSGGNCSVTLTTSDTIGFGYGEINISNLTVSVQNAPSQDYAASTPMASTYDVNWSGTRVVSAKDINAANGGWSVSLVDLNADRTAQIFYISGWRTTIGTVGGSPAEGGTSYIGGTLSDNASFGIEGETGALKMYLNGEEVAHNGTGSGNYTNWFNQTSVGIITVINTQATPNRNFTLVVGDSEMPTYTSSPVYDWCGNSLN